MYVEWKNVSPWIWNCRIAIFSVLNCLTSKCTTRHSKLVMMPMKTHINKNCERFACNLSHRFSRGFSDRNFNLSFKVSNEYVD